MTRGTSIASLLAAEMISYDAEERAARAWIEWCRQSVRRGVRVDVPLDGVPLLLDNGRVRSITTVRAKKGQR